MIEGLTNVLIQKSKAQASEGESDKTVESVALAGAAAIQRLIAERDSLRDCANAQQRDLVALSAINEGLRRRIALVRHQYVEFARKILAQLEQFDEVIRDATKDNQIAADAPDEHANLVALAHRLKPNTGHTR
jgi:hypothetical protein